MESDTDCRLFEPARGPYFIRAGQVAFGNSIHIIEKMADQVTSGGPMVNFGLLRATQRAFKEPGKGKAWAKRRDLFRGPLPSCFQKNDMDPKKVDISP
jgi:hypothetical protein